LVGLVYVVDDDSSFRRAIERRLKLVGYEVEAYASAEQLLLRLASGGGSGCILLDVRMPDLDGLSLQSRLCQLELNLPIIFLTGYADTATIVRAIKAGAEDFLTKPISSIQLQEAIEQALAHSVVRSSYRSALEMARAHAKQLTPREQQVFGMIVRGKINKQIASELGTSVRTIKAHRHQVMEKMHVKSLAELATVAERLGVLDQNPLRRA